MSRANLLRWIENFEALDGLSDAASGVVNTVAGPAKSLLSGTWLGHPLHPVLTDVPIGCWTGAVLLDLIGDKDDQAAVSKLVGVGALAALPTAAAGLSDWADTSGPPRRVGVAHAAANTVGLTLFALSLLRGRGRGRGLRLLGLGAVGAGGYLGGHLSYAQGVGVDHHVFESRLTEWTDVIEADRLADGSPALVEAGGARLLLYRRARQIFAIADTCSHAGGPLHEGEVDDSLCVTCPWHGSRFRLADGVAVRGPASMPQTAYETRVEAGRVQVRVAAS